MKETMSQFICSALVYKLFVFVELMQNIYFVMHPILQFELDIVFVQYFRQVIQYSQLTYILDAMDQNQSIILLYTAFGLQITLLFLIGLGVNFVKQKKKITTITSYSFKAISFYALILNSFLHVCFINIFFVFLICYPDSQYSYGVECYSGVYILHTVMAAIGLLLYFLIQYYFSTFYIDLKPFSDVPFAQPQNRYDYVKILFKCAILLFIIIDYKAENPYTYIIFILFLYFILLMFRIYEPQHFQLDIYNYLIACDVIQFSLAFCYTLHKFLDDGAPDTVGFYFILAAIPFIYYCAIQVSHKKNHYFQVKGIKKLGDPNQHEQLFNQLIYIIDRRDNLQNYLLLEGILVQHMETCQNTNCQCQYLSESKSKELDDLIWYKFIIQMIDLSIVKFPKSCKLHLLQSYIQNKKLNNKFKCYYSLQHIKSLETSLKEEFQSYRDLHTLEEIMQEEDQKAEIIIDVLQVVKFQKYYGQFQNLLEESVKRHYEFWCELQENNPDIQKLFTLGSQITQSVEDVKELYDKLIEINPNHINTLRIFGQFQNEVINADNLGLRILEKATQIENAQLAYSNETQTEKYGENSNTCIMTCSAETKSLGLIQSCNKEIEKLGYHKYELINQFITRLMPKCYADNHDKFMLKYLETNESKIVGRERTVYCQHKNGSIVPCLLMFKILPQLKKGLRMVNFFKILENYDSHYYILFNPTTFLIYGLSQNCQDSFGIPVNFAYGNNAHSNDFNMEILILDFNHLVEKLKISQENILTAFPLQLDTTKLQKQFIMEDSVDRLSLMDEGEINNNNNNLLNQNGTTENLKSSVKKESLFKVYKISCTVEKQIYTDLEVAILKFTEATAFQEASKSGNYYQSEIKLKSKQSKYSSSATKKKADQQINEDYLNEDRSSVNSVQSSLNDDMRRLKDFKALMSEKKVPRNIRTIQITMLSLTLILLTVSIVDLVLKGIQNTSFKYSSQILSDSYSITNQMSTITLHSRILEMIGTGEYNNSNGFAPQFLREDLITRLKIVQQLQFNTLKVNNDLQKSDVDVPTQYQYNFTSLLIDNSFKDTQLALIDSIREALSHLVIMIGTDLKNFKINDYITPAQQSFFYINYNGLRNIRLGLVERLDQIYTFFQDLISSKFGTFLALMIISIIILIITHAIVIPILLKVDRANNKVLSMFGLIPPIEIKELSDKCEKFLKDYIEDFNEKKELENRINNKNQEDNKKQQQQQDKHYIEMNNEEHIDEKQKEQIEKQKELQRIEDEEKERLRLEKQEEDKRKKQEEENKQKRYLRHKKKKKHKYNIQEIELTEDERTRIEKLERSNEKNDSSALIKFMLFFILFTGFFVTQLVLEVIYLNNVNFLFEHLKLSHQRYYIMMYRVVYGVEDIIQQKSINIDNVWMQQTYHTLIYDAERDVFESYKSFPLTGFDSYKQYYDWFNFNDMCSNITLMSPMDITVTEQGCRQVQNGILEKGLRTSVINLALYSNDSLKISGNNTKQTIINGNTFQIINDIVKYIRPAFNTLNEVYITDSHDYINYSQSIEVVKFIVLIIAWIILFFIIWMPYLTKLSIQIWQTKGMLNMIPMSIIQKNEKLKFRFLQDNIMTMVQ
ncbi:unnamed protein product [Paramecium primaurelia]|uniref:TmcB/TmcC TPR repeats domain-containing protein n=1 Tax=Paramecium primaurelia TaxID=5886 RepID=A0A8S1QF87_PARPR|nr:unnamed protein product [Paramecium primaurelia]